MSDDKDAAADADRKPREKLRLHERVEAKLSASMGFCVFCTVLLVSLIALGIIGNYYDQGWNASQWGPVAAWFGGMLTAGAVTLSLYQSRAAKKEADQNRQDAERRHVEQIEERKNFRQIDSLSPVWAALNTLTVPATMFAASLELLHTMKGQVLVQPDHGGAAAAIGFSQEQVRSASSLAIEQYKELAPYLMSTEMSFTETLIVMDHPKILPHVEKLYNSFGHYHKYADKTVAAVIKGQEFDFKELRRLKSEVSQQRNIIVNAAREHLNGARPLYLYEESTQSDLPASK
ncbi:hypothetical protein BJD99_00320 [Rhodococcus sp. 1163]|uniref:hypothetical protein n=1 Tax=Rhodococcus sp. 1163 TaxID=1905289 RepID=UPI0009FF9436|nr:hypothetical protein [Rhodococcus sp. 1163]ORI20004.1 hypothetical protein BJD99_00320 [Rhodococcus sp. 1163]